MKKTNFVLLFIFAAMCLFAQNVDERVVVIAPFDVCEKINEKEKNILLLKFRSEFVKSNKADVVDRAVLEKAKEELQFQNSDWSNSEKVAKLGEASNVGFVIYCQIIDSEDVYYVFISINNINSTKVVYEVSSQATSFKELLSKIGELAQELADGMDKNSSPRPKGTNRNDDKTTVTTTITTTTTTTTTLPPTSKIITDSILDTKSKVKKYGDKCVLIVPFYAEEIPVDETKVLFEVFRSEFAKTGVVKVVDWTSFDESMKLLKFQESDWSNVDKVAELGKAWNVNMVVTGQIIVFKKRFITTIKLIDVNTTEIVSSVVERNLSDTSEVMDKLPEMAKKLGQRISNKPFTETSQKMSNAATSSTTTTTVAASADGKTYRIGDKGPGGGIIFYVSKAGFKVKGMFGEDKVCHYMECSELFSSSMTWCSFNYDKYKNNGKYDYYCCKNDDLSIKTDFGYGKYNTSRIINCNHQHGSINASNCAAYKCNQYSTSTTKAGDWWLPSKDELDYIYSNLAKNGIIPASGWFWSSSSDTNLTAWGQSFSDGSQCYTFSKDYHGRVRAVRAF